MYLKTRLYGILIQTVHCVAEVVLLFTCGINLIDILPNMIIFSEILLLLSISSVYMFILYSVKFWQRKTWQISHQKLLASKTLLFVCFIYVTRYC